MNGYALADALLGGRETHEWWQREVARFIADLNAAGIEVSSALEKRARQNRWGREAAFLRSSEPSSEVKPHE